MYCDAKEIRFRNREEFTLKSKAKTFLIDILLDIVGGCFIAIESIILQWHLVSGSRYIRYCNRVLLFLENSNWYNDDNFEYSNYFNLLQVVGKTIFLRSIKTMLISNILMDWVVPLFPIYQGDMMLSCICMECILRNRICINLHERYLYRWSRFCFDGNTQGKATYFCRKIIIHGFYYCNYWWNSDAWKH